MTAKRPLLMHKSSRPAFAPLSATMTSSMVFIYLIHNYFSRTTWLGRACNDAPTTAGAAFPTELSTGSAPRRSMPASIAARRPSHASGLLGLPVPSRNCRARESPAARTRPRSHPRPANPGQFARRPGGAKLRDRAHAQPRARRFRLQRRDAAGEACPRQAARTGRKAGHRAAGQRTAGEGGDRRPRFHQPLPCRRRQPGAGAPHPRTGRQLRPQRAGRGPHGGVEFVSANPTGPLHVGHGRGAAIGDCLSRLLEASGWNVKREFYYNDAGVQIANLGISVQARARGLAPGDAGWPEDGYRGDYIADVAKAYLAGDSVTVEGHTVTGSKDVEDLDAIRAFAVAALRREQDLDLKAFGVAFDVYFLESSLYADGKVEETVRELVAHGHTYEEGGALWLKTTDFGDDKDRVMRKSDSTYTYFVPDVAYHLSKWQRGYEKAITELGSDHHGSLARVKAGLQALDCGIPQGYPDYVLHQMVTVMRGGEEVKISKRAGSYVTLRDL